MTQATLTPRQHPDALADPGVRMHRLMREMFPWHRSITGDGLRQTLRRIGEEIPLEISEVPSGTQVLDFTIPDEWSISNAFISDRSGNRLVDYRESNLHVVSYSQPIRRRMTWAELQPHVHSLPHLPDWIPYRTAYFEERWGFCVTDRVKQQFHSRGDDEVYEVCIDSRFFAGSLSYGECVLAGSRPEEVLISAHVCHPSLANDNLSAIVVAVELAKAIQRRPSHRWTYRFLFAPATIGAIAWLARNQHRDLPSAIQYGLVLAQLGDPGPFTYKRSRLSSAAIDRLAAWVLAHGESPADLLDFEPWGYDERQFCSPGFDLPVGRLTRTPEGRYAQYHTSADDLDLVQPDSLAQSLSMLKTLIDVLESDCKFIRTNPHGEPCLGKKNLYTPYGNDVADRQLQRALLWVLNLADGKHSLADIAERTAIAPDRLLVAITIALEHKLITLG